MTVPDSFGDHLVNVYLLPGEFVFGDSNYRVKTTLGSCVAITLWHPVLQIGGMCHFILPERCQPDNDDEKVLNGRYCSDVIKLFRGEAQRHNTVLSSYCAKIFGGASMFLSDPAHVESVGSKNVAAAWQVLAHDKIPVIASNTGNTGYRCTIFNIANGEVWVHHERQGFLFSTEAVE